jgi:SynChlorMet cassette radical SAM/SPASM protein ScmF
MIDSNIQLPDGVPALSTYYFYLTAGCNLACRHCYLTPTFQPDGGTGGHLDFELFKLAIEEGLPLGLSSVKLTGGEPLLHPDFVRMIDFLKEKELGLNIETNGTLMTSQLAQYLKVNSTLSHISVSLDGATPESHDSFRGVRGSFEKACSGIRSLVAVSYRPQVIVSLHTGNVDEIETLVRMAEALGAGSVKFNLIQPSGRGELMIGRGQVLDIQRLIELGKWVESDLQKRVSVPLFYDWPVAFHSLKRLISNGSDTCGIFSILGILSTGHLAMCGVGMLVPDLCYGKLGDNQVADVWHHHPFLVGLRNTLSSKLEGVCGNCVFQRSCLGDCAAQNFHQTGRTFSSNWFCEQAQRDGFFPQNRLQQVANINLNNNLNGGLYETKV